MTNPPWHQNLAVNSSAAKGTYGNMRLQEFAYECVLQTLQKGATLAPPVSYAAWSAQTDTKKGLEEVIRNFKEKFSEGFELLCRFQGSESYFSGDAMYHLAPDRENCTLSVEVFSRVPSFANDVLAFMKAIPPASPARGSIYALVSQQGRLTYTALGNAGAPLEPKNYKIQLDKHEVAAEKFVEQVQRNFVADPPNGRLTLLQGPPGTGKTRLLRSMIQTSGITALLLDASAIGDMTNPAFLSGLLSISEDIRDSANSTLVLVVEDGDLVIKRRQDQTLSSVSHLLNACDGILGEVLNIQVVLTSNVKREDLDPALRNGRVAFHAVVGLLPRDYAIARCRELLQEQNLPLVSVGSNWADQVSLADVYFEARQRGWVPPKTKFVEQEEDDDD